MARSGAIVFPYWLKVSRATILMDLGPFGRGDALSALLLRFRIPSGSPTNLAPVQGTPVFHKDGRLGSIPRGATITIV